MAIGQSLPELTKEIVDRFWAKVDTTIGQGPKGCCWEWQAGCDHEGYGRFHIVKWDRQANRVAYKIYYGVDPEQNCVLHICDNPSCVNPLHLKLGTHADNMAEMKAKGRGYGRPGSINNLAKLTETQVISIRQQYANGVRAVELMEAFSMSKTGIYSILQRRTWQHI